MAAEGRGGLQVRVGHCSRQGPRPDNQDFAAFQVGSPADIARFGVVAVVADGVGGHKGGRVAAETAARLFLDGHFGQSELLGVLRTSSRSLEAANRWLHTTGHVNPDLAGLGTTLTALVLRGRLAHLVHVGDTRAYRFRDGRLDLLTTDHVPNHPDQRHLLLRGLGLADNVRLDYAQDALQVHDRYVLCSDGVHGTLPDRRIADILARGAAPEETATVLVTEALANRGGDNATALVLDVLALPAPNQVDLEGSIAALPLLPAPRPGAVVDGFRLAEVLADGRYSRVFVAADVAAGQRAILKFPKPQPGADALLRQAALRESWIAARVRSPWVGQLLTLPPGRQTQLYTAMPFYEGETLEGRLTRQPPLTLATGLRVGVQLAKAVASLHRAGVVHRDIKPDNVVLLGRDGADGLRLIDLGVARLPQVDDLAATERPGTASYMAPETLNGAVSDERADQFALGVTLWRAMAGGAYPYGEVEPFSRPHFTRPASLLTRRPDLPAWLDAVLARSLSVDPANRYADVVEMAFELEHGAARAPAARAARSGLAVRNPVRFWQAVAAVLFGLLLAVAAAAWGR